MKIKGITHAGHSAVFIKTNDASIGMDPWIKGNHCATPAFDAPSDLSLIILSHGNAGLAGNAPDLSKLKLRC